MANKGDIKQREITRARVGRVPIPRSRYRRSKARIRASGDKLKQQEDELQANLDKINGQVRP